MERLVEKEINQINFQMYPYNEAQEYTNGTEYLSCFYSNLFMFLKSCEKNIEKYIANNIFCYGFNPEQEDLRRKYEIQCIACEKINTMYEESGIEIREESIETDNVLNFITNSIKENMPVTVKVDLYYLSYRPDRFMKVHTNHYVMVHGYNPKSKELYIFDNPENQEYYQCTMRQDEFIRAFQSAYKTKEKNVFQYKNVREEKSRKTVADCKSIFLDNIKTHQKEILTSINNIDEIKDEFIRITQNQNIWDKHKEKLFFLMHYHILNKKKSQLYTFHLFLEEGEFVDTMKKIVSLWEEIRNICSYYYIQGKYKKELISQVISDICIIKELEEKLY